MRRLPSPHRLELLLGVFGFAVGCLAAEALSAQEVRVSAGTIEDRRTTGKFFAGLEIELKLTGDDVADAKAARLLVKKAVDETGRDLLPEARSEADFQQSFGGGAPDLKVSLKNPARNASAVKEISGQIELFLPSRDPAATVVVDRILSRMDKPVESAALRSQQVEVKVVSPKVYRAEAKKREAELEKEMAKHKGEMEKEVQAAGEDPKMAEALIGLVKAFSGMMGEVGDNDLVLEIRDEEKRILDIDVLGPGGDVVDSQGSMSSGGVKILKFSEKLPADAKLKLLLKTKKSVVAAPFTLANVPLP